MKLLLSTLLTGAVIAIATPASADNYYRTSEAQFRHYCQDEDYYDRYEWYCSRFDRDNDHDYDSGDDDDGIRNSNYNHNRAYLRGHSWGEDDADGDDGDQDDSYDDNDY